MAEQVHQRREPRQHAELLPLLVTSLEALALAGQVDEACRIAGQACARLRLSDQQGWNMCNALLHRLARQAPLVGTNAPEEAD